MRDCGGNNEQQVLVVVRERRVGFGNADTLGGPGGLRAMIAFSPAIPVLRSFSEAKAKEFYLGFLGFAVDFEHRFAPDMPLYMGISRNGVKLHISEHFGDAMPGGCVYIEMTGLREFQAELIAKEYKFARPGINPGHGGGIGIDLADPFGNKLRFNERDG